jgi:uncharacterized membrane protein YeaQ/YmgE (transglycosylase-associated protein family)
MGIIMWLVIGGIVGWLASIIMRRDAQQGIFLNIIVGIIGAALAGWLIAPLLGAGTINQGLSVTSFLVSLVGAILLLAIVNLFTPSPCPVRSSACLCPCGSRQALLRLDRETHRRLRRGLKRNSP